MEVVTFLVFLFCLRGWGTVLYSGVRFFEREGEGGWVCVNGLAW